MRRDRVRWDPDQIHSRNQGAHSPVGNTVCLIPWVMYLVQWTPEQYLDLRAQFAGVSHMGPTGCIFRSRMDIC